MTGNERIKIAENRTNTEPTEKQKVSGNYKKGSVTVNGLKITIENPEGSIRSGIDRDGTPWSIHMKYAYGYINSTIGKDKDQVDVFIGNSLDQKFEVYVVDQIDPGTKAFDEHKVMFGFLSKEEAKQAYMDSYNDNWGGFGNITSFSLPKFKKWLKNVDFMKYPASKLNKSATMSSNVIDNDDTKVIELSGEVLEGETLNDLKKQAGDLKGISILVLEIASPGGSVSEGLEIMAWLDQISTMGIKVATVVTANAYSIASLIMLAADVRLISKHGEVMVHNPMLPELKYVNANDLEGHLKILRELENYLYDLYQIFTGLDKDTIKNLMDKETYLSPADSIKFNFADTVIDIKPKPFEMVTNNQKKEVNMSKTLNILNKVIAKVAGAEIVNQLYYTNEGEAIEIFQADASTYQEGDSTNAEDGQFKLSDGSLITVKDSKIEKIEKSVPVENTEDPEIEADPEKEIVPAPEENLPSGDGDLATPSVEPLVEPVDEGFNEGPAPQKDKDKMPAKVVEKTESTVTTKETVAKAEETPDKEAPEAIVEAPSVEAPVDINADLSAKIEALEAKYADLAAKFEASQKQIEETKGEVNKNTADLLESGKFQDLATEAIDKIAQATTSDFKPEAKAVATEAPQGSIFQRMKAARGLK